MFSRHTSPSGRQIPGHCPDVMGQLSISVWVIKLTTSYLYGRGVSDNKGPILAVACAAAALRQRRELDVDLVMLIEGEEEAGSRGFASTVRKHKVGHIRVRKSGASRLIYRRRSDTSTLSCSRTRPGSTRKTRVWCSACGVSSTPTCASLPRATMRIRVSMEERSRNQCSIWSRSWMPFPTGTG